MSDVVRGWLYVGAQVGLLAALVLLPSRADWPTPGWVRTLGYVGILAGLALVAVASLGLGRALTPTPVPNRRGGLRTDGLYRFARHPIYTGVLTIVAGLVLRSGSLVSLAVGVVTVIFFDAKARWEELKLAEVFPDYPDYAARTARFFPHPFRRR